MTNPAPAYLPAELIKRKREGQVLADAEIRFLIDSYTNGSLPDYQMAAWLMTVFFRGLSPAETLTLTDSMLHSGRVMDFSQVPGFKVDKHSTGGVGDKTSLILGPIVAACGLPVPMISGRGLGHTGGTLDKLESIPGFNTQLSLDAFANAVAKHGIALVGQTKEICPADKKIYALRDVTGTVESLPLICASIMSKKLAEGIDGLVLDVKFGSGAFMKALPDAEKLARALMDIAVGHGKKVSALLTNMDQPLGRFAGNALEVQECIEILQGQHRDDPLREETRELSIQLAAQMLWLGGMGASVADCAGQAKRCLDRGEAWHKFQELCQVQGGDLGKLPKAPHRWVVPATSAAFLSGMDTERLGYACLHLRAGRAQVSDEIEPTAGLEFHCKVGAQVKPGDAVITLYGADRDLLQKVAPLVASTLTWSSQPTKPRSLIEKELHTT